ncbi:MAG: metallophosphoesterase, partial [Promethearchaeota archaeon]
FWYAFYTAYTWLFVSCLIIYGLGMSYAVFLFIKLMRLFLRKPIASTKIKNRYRLPASLLLAVSLFFLLYFNIPSVTRHDMYPHLSFTGDPRTSITVAWYSTNAYRGSVQYGIDPGNLSAVVRESGENNEHEITLTGLTPGTKYYYRIDGFDSVWSFSTATSDNENLSFVVISDIHNQLYEPMVQDIVDEDPAFIIASGDLVDYGGWHYQWSIIFDQVSPFATRYPMMTCIGNHDSMVRGTANYLEYLAMPNSSGSELYYQFVYNGIHFFVLDLQWGTETYTAEEKAWFENALANTTADEWVVVVNHAEHYSSGAYGNLDNMINTFHDLFVQYDVDLVINGHDHHAEILQVDGIVYTVNGVANTRYDPSSATNHSYSIYYVAQHSGYARVSFAGNSCTYEFQLYEDGLPMEPLTYTFSK